MENVECFPPLLKVLIQALHYLCFLYATDLGTPKQALSQIQNLERNISWASVYDGLGTRGLFLIPKFILRALIHFHFLMKQQIVQLDLSFSWAFGVKWSPSGNTLAYVGHNSMIYFVDDVGPSPLAQNVAFRDLPLRDVLFVSEKMVIGVGFDCNPMVFAADERGIWYVLIRKTSASQSVVVLVGLDLSFIRFLGERKSTLSGSKYGSQNFLTVDWLFHSLWQFSEAFGKLYGQSKLGVNNDGIEASRSRGGVHENCINCIVSLTESASSRKMRFSTSGLDGKVVVWDLENQEDLSGYL
ncbi:hypothetical protein DKX38_021382 [Salix brachista]|uniref:Uncharacterized protein n=1 Tax=Salix brachista TaxID=2182728 RepID=A0A5N5KC50_9ROSI|nr:hypothetical protein DKX38_021382 [Salix brachista]